MIIIIIEYFFFNKSLPTAFHNIFHILNFKIIGYKIYIKYQNIVTEMRSI